MDACRHAVVSLADLSCPSDGLKGRGYCPVGPREGAIICAQIKATDDLPVGWTDCRDGGKSGLKKREDAALFGYAIGPRSQFLFLPRQRMAIDITEEVRSVRESERAEAGLKRNQKSDHAIR